MSAKGRRWSWQVRRSMRIPGTPSISALSSDPAHHRLNIWSPCRAFHHFIDTPHHPFGLSCSTYKPHRLEVTGKTLKARKGIGTEKTLILDQLSIVSFVDRLFGALVYLFGNRIDGVTYESVAALKSPLSCISMRQCHSPKPCA